MRQWISFDDYSTYFSFNPPLSPHDIFNLFKSPIFFDLSIELESKYRLRHNLAVKQNFLKALKSSKKSYWHFAPPPSIIWMAPNR